MKLFTCCRRRFIPRQIAASVATMVGTLILMPVNGKTDDVPVKSRQLPVNVVTIETFVRADSERCERAVRFLTNLTKQNDGLRLVVHDVLEDEAQLRRLWKLARRSGHEKAVVPTVYCCKQLHCGFDDKQTTEPKIVELLTMHVYARSTCPRCQKAKKFLKGLQRRWPGIRITIHEITSDTAARSRWDSLSRKYGVVPGLPSIHFSGRFIVGYRGDTVTGKEIETLLRKTAGPPDVPKPVPKSVQQSRRPSGIGALQSVSLSFAAALLSQNVLPGTTSDSIPLPDESEDLPLPDDDDLGGSESGEQVDQTDDAIDVPVLGELRISEIGLPTFTFLVGLVDGFNPCAMWVLVFLLSVLVNVKDRRRMILIAGTFVVVSGLAYFTFMAAWLNLFMLVGIARPSTLR